jgi:hypothetical protein
MIRQILVLGFLFFGLGIFAQETKGIVSLLPKDVEWDEWAITDSAEIHTGEDLYLYINDGVDIYLEYGFEQVVNIRYKNSVAVKMHLEIYEMTDPGAAFGIFTMNSSGKGIPEEIGDAAMMFDYYLHFVKDRYYVRVTTFRKEEATLEAIRKFALIVEENIPAKGAKPKLLNAFNLKDKELKKLKYIRGQIALGNIYNFGHGSVAGFSEGISANSEGKMFFVFAYKDEKECREWFASCKGKMHMNTKFTDYTSVEDGVTVIDKAGNYLSFKPYGKFYMVVKGMNWKEAAPVFAEMMENLQSLE